MSRAGDRLKGLAGAAGQSQNPDDREQAERGRGAGSDNLGGHMAVPGPRFEVTAGRARDDPRRRGEHQRDDGPPRPGPGFHLGHLPRHLELALFVQVHLGPSLVIR